MKSLNLIALLAIIFVLSSCNFNSNIPVLVKKKFKELYPYAEEVKWEVKSPDTYRADFQLDNREWNVSFSRYGAWLVSTTKIPVGKVPSISLSYVGEFYPNLRVSNYILEKKPEGVYYIIELEKDKKNSFKVEFDSTGKMNRDDNNVILKKFRQMFQNVRDVKWVKTGDNNFDVFFKNDDIAYRAQYSINGDWLLTENIVKENNVPSTVPEYLKKNYKNYDLKGMMFQKTPESSKYVVSMIKDDKEINLHFNTDGKFVKKVVIGEK